MSEQQVIDLLETATREAAAAAKQELHGLQPFTEVEGGFGGLGQPSVLLSLLHAAEAGLKAAALGVSASAGKMFFENFLAPRLRKLNLLPSKFHLVSPKTPSRSRKKSTTKRNRPTI